MRPLSYTPGQPLIRILHCNRYEYTDKNHIAGTFTGIELQCDIVWLSCLIVWSILARVEYYEILSYGSWGKCEQKNCGLTMPKIRLIRQSMLVLISLTDSALNGNPSAKQIIIGTCLLESAGAYWLHRWGLKQIQYSQSTYAGSHSQMRLCQMEPQELLSCYARC